MAGQRETRDALERLLERPVVDYAGAALVTGAMLITGLWWHGLDVLGHLDPAQRTDLYGRLIGPLSIVASFGTAGLAVYASASGPAITLMRGVYGKTILKQFRGAAVAAGVTVLTLVVAFVAQQGYQANWSRWIVIAAFTWVVLRTARVIYFYTNVLKVADEDKMPPRPRRSLDELPVRQPSH